MQRCNDEYDADLDRYQGQAGVGGGSHEAGLERHLGAQSEKTGDDDPSQSQGNTEKPPDEHGQHHDERHRDDSGDYYASEYLGELHRCGLPCGAGK